MDLIITFDTQDVYTPAEAGMDAIPKALADILYEEGVPANFMVIAQRAEVLRQRGRQDVIAALKRHSVGVHTRYDAQPYDATLATELDWAGGLEVCRRMQGEAQRVCVSHEVALDERFSPAELALAFAGALLAFAQDGRLPEALPRQNDVLGPVQDPLTTPEEPGQLGWTAILELASALKEATAASGYLPANLAVRGGRAGLGSVYHVLARSHLALCQDGVSPESVDLWRFPRQPRVGLDIGARYATLSESLLVPPDLNTGNLYRFGKLQAWTLAPACREP